jgi:hypothetical protein
MRKFIKATMPIMAGAMLLVLGASTASWAGEPIPVPEVDPATGAAAFALVAGAVLIIRARRK